MKRIKSTIYNHKYLFLTIIFSIIVFLMFLPLSNHNNVWYDEAYQMVLNRNSLLDIIYYVGRDFSPPFYAILLKIVTSIFGSSLLVARIVSLSAILSLIWLAFYPMRKVFNLRVSLIFVILLITVKFILYAGIEIRPYSWPMFFTLASLIYILLILKENKTHQWVLYALFGILGSYSHNYAILGIFVINTVFFIYVLIKRRDLILKYLLFTGIVIIAFLPWLGILGNQINALNNNFWIPKPNQYTFVESVRFLFFNSFTLWGTIITGLVIGIINCISYNKSDLKKGIFIILPFIITIGLFVYSSMTKKPMFIPRYIVPLSGMLILFISIMFANIKSKLLLVLVLIIWIVPIFKVYKEEYGKTDDSSTYEIQKFVLDNSIKNEDIVFLQDREFDLGELSYYFKDAIHICHSKTDTVLTNYDLFKTVIEIEDILEAKDITRYLWINNILFETKMLLLQNGWKEIKEDSFYNPYFGSYRLTYFEYVGLQ